CETGSHELGTSASANVISLLWTSNGDGTFSDPTVLHPVYTPGPIDIVNGTVTLTITGMSALPCIPVFDDMTITISRQALADAGVDDTICETGTYSLTTALTHFATGIQWTSSGFVGSAARACTDPTPDCVIEKPFSQRTRKGASDTKGPRT
ncbi:MAG: hypothetical protein NTW68_05030, partial [candidate division NC10 bacterium]|nr:hypothetical protein [candidate division NC10 bacterium]